MLTVRLTPRASRDEIVGTRGGVLAVKVSAPAVDDRANAALRRLVAKAASLPRGRVEIVRGRKGREKLLRLDGLSGAEAAARLR